MSHQESMPTEDEACEGASGNTLTAGLLIQTATTSGNRRWIRYAFIGVFIASHKKTRCHYKPPPPADQVIDIPLSNRIARIVREKDLTSLQNLGGVDRISSLLRSPSEDDAVDGVQNPQVWNTTKSAVDEKGFLYFLLEACSQYAIILLLLSAGFSFAVEFIKEGLKYGWHDGVAILFAVFLLVSFPSVRNYYNEIKLRKHLLERSKLVIYAERSSGEPSPVSISEIVVGDIVHLNEGDRVPADGLFIDHGESLVVDEVLNPNIDREQNPFVFSGSKVTNGRGRMIVTSIGANTACAEVLSLGSDHKPNEKTLLQALMDKPYACMDYLTLCVSILIPLVMLIRHLVFRKHENYNDRPELKGEVSMNLVMRIFERIFLKPKGRASTLASVLATVVIGMQHGMPFVVTLALCKWKEKMVQNQADPQNLSACVTMGLMTVICIETTGELMQNQGEVKEFWVGDKDFCINGVDFETHQVVREALHQGISLAPSPTNDLIISWLTTRCGTDMELLDKSFEIVGQRQLSYNEECSRILVRKIENQTLQFHCNGAASTVLDKCSHYSDNGGESHITKNRKRKFKQVIKKMEKNGLRSIAYAYKNTLVQEPTEEGLILLALVGVRRPYQEELKLTVEALRRDGVSIKLVSEDELSTVIARASQLGISPGSNDMPIEGGVFRRLSSMERQDKLDLIYVMGGSHPMDKFLMVERLKRKGHVVGFHGGLTITDTPTLIVADVGITEDIRSTEMARENADLIIRNVRLLAPIRKSAACAYYNIRKFSQLQLTACISGLLITVVATMHSGESPLTAIHLIWVNLIMCLLGGLMMVMELHGPALLTERPAKRTESLVTKVIRRDIVIQASYQASVLLILHFMGNVVPSLEGGVRNTMIFNTYTLCQVLNLSIVMELLKKEVLQVVLQSYWFLMALGAVLIMQVIVIQFGKGLASGVRLDGLQWLTCFLLAALSWVLDWAVKSLSVRIKRTTSALMVNSPMGFSNRRRRL